MNIWWSLFCVFIGANVLLVYLDLTDRIFLVKNYKESNSVLLVALDIICNFVAETEKQAEKLNPEFKANTKEYYMEESLKQAKKILEERKTNSNFLNL